MKIVKKKIHVSGKMCVCGVFIEIGMDGYKPNFVVNYLRSIQFSCSVMSHSLRPHEPQHARPPCLSPTPGVHPNPCPFSR